MKQKLRQLKDLATFNNMVLLIALIIAVSWVWSTMDAIGHNFKLQRQVDDLNQQVALAELQNKTLELQNKYYGSDQFLELSAREHLGLALPGEKVIILPPNKVQPQQQAVQQPSGDSKSNFEQWMYFLFGSKG